VVVEGEAGDRFYLIESGAVAVTQGGAELRREGPGDFFGEIALLRDVPRTATATAITDVSLVTLERAPFVAAVSGHASSTAEADSVIAARLGSFSARGPATP
jgi:CRP-like cAMP-binding protein